MCIYIFSKIIGYYVTIYSMSSKNRNRLKLLLLIEYKCIKCMPKKPMIVQKFVVDIVLNDDKDNTNELQVVYIPPINFGKSQNHAIIEIN